ncbi:MAG: transcription antitermination factor NusB [Minisyncoccia bacterium]
MSMRTRHFARTIVLQALFEYDSQGWEGDISTLLNNTIGEYAPKTPHRPFMERVVATVLAKKTELDAIIQKAAPEWPIDRIAVIDRNVLRLGISELLFGDRNDVPPKVAINEAIELAKEFGGETSGKFVNGVIGAVYREIGEPNKEEGEKRQEKNIVVPTEALVGAVVYAVSETGDMYITLVHDVFGYWTLIKGKLEDDESTETAVLRKVQEEVGLVGTIKEALGENEYIAHDPETGRRKRKATYFLVQTEYADLHLKKGGGLDDARWFRLAETGGLRFYDDLIPVITRAVNALARM